MEIIESFAFLPETLHPNLRVAVYILILLHVLALSCWLCVSIPDILKKEESFDKKLERVMKKNNEGKYE
jgi:starvation-inducible outer membrane lipoprotein